MKIQYLVGVFFCIGSLQPIWGCIWSTKAPKEKIVEQFINFNGKEELLLALITKSNLNFMVHKTRDPFSVTHVVKKNGEKYFYLQGDIISGLSPEDFKKYILKGNCFYVPSYLGTHRTVGALVLGTRNKKDERRLILATHSDDFFTYFANEKLKKLALKEK
jgi:hypothetical protein